MGWKVGGSCDNILIKPDPRKSREENVNTVIPKTLRAIIDQALINNGYRPDEIETIFAVMNN